MCCETGAVGPAEACEASLSDSATEIISVFFRLRGTANQLRCPVYIRREVKNLLIKSTGGQHTVTLAVLPSNREETTHRGRITAQTEAFSQTCPPWKLVSDGGLEYCHLSSTI
ncbi:hypothetical protein JOB18_024232 [Solea senegalensis]|uniref:Uncharacterized protein n=1 Tax=Solea senegalensis TaxID=28829 RepID=A0AAV6ST48_SOLSE|nr:hypothetical protein JOB18_024232 [Solea senegalensis]